MAIGAIIGFILFIMLAISIVVVTMNVIKAKSKRIPSSDRKYKTTNVAGGVAILIALGLLVTIPGSFHTVNSGEIAVVKTLGKISKTRTAGTYFDFWMVNNYEVYDATVQQINIVTPAYTADSQPMDISLTVQFQIQQDNVTDIATNYGRLELLANRIEAVSTERTKSVLSQYKAETLIVERANISPMVETAIRSAISDKFYVDFNAAVLTDIAFSDAFEKAVEEKMTAEQDKLKAAYENEQKIAQAKAELEIAKTTADASIQTAEGQAEAKRRLAKAEADSVKLKSIETARMLGFTIITTTTTEGDEYTIDFTGKSAEEIKLISDYLKYASYLEAWDGKLPETYVADGTSASILIPTTSTTTPTTAG